MATQRVLIVDDNPSLLLILTETFRLGGFEVATADDGDSAITEARRLCPDLLVLDVGLPGRNGFEVCRTLREDPDLAELPIVLLTARTADGDRHWGLDAGADEYLTKPFDPDKLVATAREIIASRHAGETRNPLTKLPDLDALVREVRSRRANGDQLVVRAVEFEARSATIMRQKYGDPVSAHAIRLAATCLREGLAANAGDGRWVLGHAGDASYSRFAVAAPAAKIDAALATAIALFAKRVPALYDPADRQRGAVTARGADGDMEQVPLLALHIVTDQHLEADLGEAA
jgi:DNA-binding response OmpR family regulator